MSFISLVFLLLFFQYKQFGLYVLVKSDYYLQWKDLLNVLAAIEYNYSSPGCRTTIPRKIAPNPKRYPELYA